MNITWPSPVGGAVPPRKPFFHSLLTNSLFACLSSMNFSFVGGAKLLHSVLFWCAPIKLFSERKTPSRELKYTAGVKLQTTMGDSQVQPHEPQIRCNSGEALWCSNGSRFSTIINHGRWLTSVFIIYNRRRISRNWASFIAAILSCVDANGGWWWCGCSLSPP